MRPYKEEQAIRAKAPDSITIEVTKYPNLNFGPWSSSEPVLEGYIRYTTLKDWARGQIKIAKKEGTDYAPYEKLLEKLYSLL